MDWSHQGRLGNWLTVNGETNHFISVAARTVRLCLVNAANARVLAFRLGADRPMRVVALDGAQRDPFDLQTIRLAPAQRADIMMELLAGAFGLRMSSPESRLVQQCCNQTVWCRPPHRYRMELLGMNVLTCQARRLLIFICRAGPWAIWHRPNSGARCWTFAILRRTIPNDGP